MSTNEAHKEAEHDATSGADANKREAIVKAARVMFTTDGY